ncbi:C2H2-type domain-containing protein [Mycena indigotica]|uniref:C2H2-type domain-containing protein n=1 Tax=Mycena indigotica TaxID=2126181 RepID=A0A8H6S0X9_9AGAR|nr:C2H2-type domain-containing protein [Mycena indigotica]KAF7290661.1 C2H2-type domain-containing protein [Mycena indigotica]
MAKGTRPRTRAVGPRGRKTIALLKCAYVGCGRHFKTSGGLTNHVRTDHSNPTLVGFAPNDRDSVGVVDDDIEMEYDQPDVLSDTGQDSNEEPDPVHAEPQLPAGWHRHYHPHLSARPCDEDGNDLLPGTPPPPRRAASPTNWTPYEDKVQFRTAEILFRQAQVSGGNINELLEVWALDKLKHDDLAPFANADHLYEAIDATKLGDAPWHCLESEPLASGADAPEWARRSYTVWYRNPETVATNMLDNPAADGHFDYVPFVETDANNKRRWSNFMSANFAWRHADKIYEDDPSTEGACLVPIFAGADKTTVSVGTGDIEYHPGYMALGNHHNSFRCGHRNGVIPFIFLAIPKSDRKYDNDKAFRVFKQQLYHASLAAIFSFLKPGMTTPCVRRCPDGHFRKVIFDFGPFIADYPEQVTLAGVVYGWCTKCTNPVHDLDNNIGTRRTHQLTNELIDAFDGDPKVLWTNYGINADIIPFTNDFPRADIHEMISPDILHQLIKGSFKDHLVEWVSDYLYLTHNEAEANSIMDEIDKRIAATPAYPGLRRFRDGRRFKQWTGDNSKALMKVYLPALKGLLPTEIVQVISTFLDFCYLSRRKDFDESTLDQIETTVDQFRERRKVFVDVGVRTDFNLPRQHSIGHYAHSIREFASRADFEQRGMLEVRTKALPDKLPTADDKDDDGIDDGPRVEGTVVLARTREPSYPRSAHALAAHIGFPDFPPIA